VSSRDPEKKLRMREEAQLEQGEREGLSLIFGPSSGGSNALLRNRDET